MIREEVAAALAGVDVHVTNRVELDGQQLDVRTDQVIDRRIRRWRVDVRKG